MIAPMSLQVEMSSGHVISSTEFHLNEERAFATLLTMLSTFFSRSLQQASTALHAISLVHEPPVIWQLGRTFVSRGAMRISPSL